MAKDGTLSSIIELNGVNRHYGNSELCELASEFRLSLSTLLDQPGHSVEITFQRNRKLSAIGTCSGNQEDTIHYLTSNSDIRNLLRSEKNLYDRHTIEESVLLTVFTHPDFDSGRNHSILNQLFSAVHPFAKNTQHTESDIQTRHVTSIEALCRSLTNIGHQARIISVRNYLQHVKSSLYPNSSVHVSDWQPQIHGDDGTGLAMNNQPKEQQFQDNPGIDTTVEVYSFDEQLASEPIHILNSSTIECAGSIISGFDITIAPERLVPFNTLLNSVAMIVPDLSWRCVFKFHANGLETKRLRENYIRFFAFTNPIRHGRMRDAFDQLHAINGSTDTVVQLQISFATWSNAANPAQHSRNYWILRRSVEQWGNCQTDSVTGDSVATIVSSVPGLDAGGTAPSVAVPLNDALALSPIARPASPWEFGDVMFQAENGRQWPYKRGSGLQNSWSEIFVGTSGSGKSVALNAFNLGSLLSYSDYGENNKPLMQIAIVDVGISSKGLVDLIQESLPKERQHEAVYAKLKMLPEYSINIFDTPLGFRRPTAEGRTFLINFLSVLIDQSHQSESIDGTGMIGALIDLSYLEVSDRYSPKRYVSGEYIEIDRAIAKIGYQLENTTCWWEIVDTLFKHGFVPLAQLAQTRAVPVLADLLTANYSHQIQVTYGNDDENSSGISKRMCQAISEVIRDMPIIASPTRFALEGARLVSLDLEEVTMRSDDWHSQRQTALMYMLARNIVFRNRMLDNDDISSMTANESLPEMYETHHLQMIEYNQTAPKIVCMDEFHRVGGIPAVRRQVLQEMREGRKYNIRIALASQYAEDFGDGILESASSVFIFDAPSTDSIQLHCKNYNLSNDESTILRTHLIGPTSEGVPLFAVFKTKKGMFRHKLWFTVDPIELWCFTTTSEDVKLRNRMYQTMDTRHARNILASNFPSGSAKRYIERRLSIAKQYGGNFCDIDNKDIFDQIISEMLTKSLPHTDNIVL